ncbi:MAG: PGF-CTERM sorting domain-containing protein, partial [Candidatus Poseidoniaceae archaeon]|nr:PGF-CTERM sorting domain-containing protein [Candidatus Poseidoniaceae archaeon]
SCWPTDLNGNYNLVFTQETRVISDFQRGYFSSSQGFTGNNNWTTIETNVDVTINNERGIINSVVPGFEAILTLVAMCVALLRYPSEQNLQTK